MRIGRAVSISLLAGLLAAPVAASVQQQAEVVTTLAFMIGSRQNAEAPAASVLIFPRDGSVTPSQIDNVAGEVASVQGKVKDAMGLASLEMVSWDNIRMRVGDAHTVPLSGSGGTLTLKLLDVKGETAVYEVTRVSDGTGGGGVAKTLRTTINVTLGGYSIIGTGGADPLGFTVVGASSGSASGVLGATVSYGQELGSFSALRQRSEPMSSTATISADGTRRGTGSGAVSAVGPGGATNTTFEIKSSDTVVTPPRLDGRPHPPFLGNGQTGTVILEGTIATDGSIVDARVVKGPDALGLAALDVFTQWKFVPGRDKHGNPVACPITVSVVYRDPLP